MQLAVAGAAAHLAGVERIEGIEWRVSESPVPYEEALAFMDERAAAIREGAASECVWLLEHPPLFTAGTSADPAELINPLDFPVYEAGRGGRYTYHGPGQRVGYLLLDLDKRGRDVRRLVHSLEGWIIESLADFDDDLSANAVEQYVSRLRKRLAPYELTVKTARGLGYYLDKAAP